MDADAIPALIVTATVVAGAVSDFRGFRLPNLLTLPLVLSGLLWHFAGGAADGLTRSCLGLLLATLPLLPAYAGGGMGAGDVKLMAGIGAWMGALFALQVLILAGLFGWAIYRHRRERTLRQPLQTRNTKQPANIEEALQDSQLRSTLLPFGVMIAAGTLVLTVIGGPV
ncbi:MAG: hypothetical protein RL215_1229 [Planctomycetota bacterium]|jgi:prepilin peptidase CpaA